MGNETIRFVYVDDDEGLLEVTKASMEQRGGFEVDAFLSASAALDALAQEDYDAVVSDYEMPEMDGIDLLKILRGRDGRIPFILFTGRGREEVAIDALNNGADFYLEKGGDPRAQYAELANMVRQAVSRRYAEKAVVEQLERTRKLNRMFRFLSDINHTIVHVRDRDELFERCCRIAVEKGGFRAAVVGLLDRSTMVMAPFIHYGEVGDYLTDHRHNLRLPQERRSPMGRAVIENQLVLCNNIETDRSADRWRERALRNGLLSSVHIPIRQGGEPIGLFSLYSSKCHHFDDEEIVLMKEIVEDISLSIAFIRGEQIRQAMEQELVVKEKRYRDTLDGMLEGCQIVGYDWRYLYLNDAAVEASGKTREELIGNRMTDVYPQILDTDLFRMLRSCMEERKPVKMMNEFAHTDGTAHWYDLSVEPTNEGVFILSQDCTARIRAEKDVLMREGILKKFIDETRGDDPILDENGTRMSVETLIRRADDTAADQN